MDPKNYIRWRRHRFEDGDVWTASFCPTPYRFLSHFLNKMSLDTIKKKKSNGKKPKMNTSLTDNLARFYDIWPLGLVVWLLMWMLGKQASFLASGEWNKMEIAINEETWGKISIARMFMREDCVIEVEWE